MIQPNSDAIGFTNWMLNISKQHLSGPQRIIVQNVYNAAVGNYPISDQEWYNFNLFAAWRNPYYLVFSEYASVVEPNLLMGLIHAYNMEGNANDLVGSQDGTVTDMLFNVLFGKIDQGAGGTGPNSKIDFGDINTSSDWTVNLWVYLNSIASPYTNLFGPSTGGEGLIVLPSDGTFDYYIGPDYTFNSVITTGSWHNVVLRSTADVLELFLNNVKNPTSRTASTHKSVGRLGSSGSSNKFDGFMDMYYVWNRSLSDIEISELWNGGAGIQYPF